MLEKEKKIESSPSKKIEKVIISEAVEYDECRNEDGKMSTWKCFKKFWTPKNWFDYKGYCSKENFWHTILANIGYPFLGTILALIILVPIYKLLGSAGAFIAATIGICAFAYFFVGSTLGYIGLLFRRANTAGLSSKIVLGGYVIPVALGLIFSIGEWLTTKQTASYDIFRSLSSITNIMSLVTLVTVGVHANKHLEKKVIKKTVLLEKVEGSDTSLIIDEKPEEELVFFKNENNK